jgi:hypothetical protein
MRRYRTDRLMESLEEGEKNENQIRHNLSNGSILA